MRALTPIAATALGLALLATSAAAQVTAGAAPAGPPAVEEVAIPPELGPQPIVPANAVENAFVAALTNPEMRPVFRHLLLDSQVAVALDAPGENASAKMVPIQNNAQAAAIFTSVERLHAVMGPNAPFVMLTGRAALTRLQEHNVAINYMWVPMLTLEPEDIGHWIETPTTEAPPAEAQPAEPQPHGLILPHGLSAGPTQ